MISLHGASRPSSRAASGCHCETLSRAAGAGLRARADERVRAFCFIAALFGVADRGLYPTPTRQDSKRQIIPLCAKDRRTGKGAAAAVCVRALDRFEGNRFFWTGNCSIKTAIGNWQRSMARLSKLGRISFMPISCAIRLPPICSRTE